MNLTRLSEELQALKNKDNLRQLKTYCKNGIDFFSNDYLGLSKNSTLLNLLSKNHINVDSIGSTGSRLISGNSEIMLQAEQFFANFYSAESSLYFGSGYLANLAIFSTIPKKNDTVIYDQYIHASIRDGLKLGNANSYSFKHNDYNDLEKKIKQAKGKVFVVIEGIYSMDGDSPNYKEIERLVAQYDVLLILDEAHSLGILGENGLGWSEIFPKEKIFARVYTFGKSMGYHGAIIVGNKALIDYLINFSRPFIYTTATHEINFQNLELIHHYFKNNYQSLMLPLQENSNLFNQLFEQENISPIKVFKHKDLKSIESKLFEANILTKIIKHPTVPKGQERIRICLHNYNTTAQIKTLHQIIHS